MNLAVRPMLPAEADLIIDYFHNATPAFLISKTRINKAIAYHPFSLF